MQYSTAKGDTSSLVAVAVAVVTIIFVVESGTTYLPVIIAAITIVYDRTASGILGQCA